MNVQDKLLQPRRIVSSCKSERWSTEKKVSRKHILIVDDEPFNIAILSMMLQSLSHDPDSAEDGNSALSSVMERAQDVFAGKQEMYKLILMDFSMPDMNGTEVTRKIRQFISSSGLSQPFICCCSAYTDQAYRD